VKKLEDCRWVPRWVSHLGCIKGCLEYLGVEISEAWLYGGTGHAFVINLHEQVCPSGPTAWKTEKLFHLGKNLGYTLDGIFGFKVQDDFQNLQRKAWEHVRQSIDENRPCYGWELEIPEFYVVNGYDDTGYYISGPGCDEGKGPKPWQEFGDTGIGVLEMYSVAPGRIADDDVTVKEALTFALEHAANPPNWIFEHYRAGLEGYDNWIHALDTGIASDMGTRYNIAVWLECRKNALGFLEEARERLDGRAEAGFQNAITHYQAVVENLDIVASIYRWLPNVSDGQTLPVDERSHQAVDALSRAREAERFGLEALQEIVQKL